MILLDTSVVIDYWRKPRPAVEAALAKLKPCLCGIVIAELLQGASSPEDAARTEESLVGFEYLNAPEEMWRDLGTNLAALRMAGKSVPFQDVLLATVAILHDAELWTLDAHYAMIQTVLRGLRLLPNPVPEGPSS